MRGERFHDKHNLHFFFYVGSKEPAGKNELHQGKKKQKRIKQKVKNFNVLMFSNKTLKTHYCRGVKP